MQKRMKDVMAWLEALPIDSWMAWPQQADWGAYDLYVVKGQEGWYWTAGSKLPKPGDLCGTLTLADALEMITGAEFGWPVANGVLVGESERTERPVAAVAMPPRA